MKPILRPVLFAVLAFSASTVSLLAQTPSPGPQGPPDGPPPHGHHGPPPSPLFRALDTNHDGVISAEEMANAPAVLRALADSSGQITRESLRPKHPDRDDRRAPDDRDDRANDPRGPGPDHEEHAHHRPPPPPDAQDSPAASPDSETSPSPSPQHGPDGRHHGPPPPDDARDQAAPLPFASPGGSPAAGPENRRHGPPHGDPLFEALDTNHDGVISADEIDAAAVSLKKADTNGDGKIDRADMRPPPPRDQDRDHDE